MRKMGPALDGAGPAMGERNQTFPGLDGRFCVFAEVWERAREAGNDQKPLRGAADIWDKFGKSLRGRHFSHLSFISRLCSQYLEQLLAGLNSLLTAS